MYALDRVLGPRWLAEAEVALALEELEHAHFPERMLHGGLLALEMRAPALDVRRIWTFRAALAQLARAWRRLAQAQADADARAAGRE